MTKVLLFLGLVLLSSAYGFQDRSIHSSLETSLPFINAVGTSSPHIFLTKSDVQGNSGWNIETDLASESHRTANAYTFPYNVSMKLALYSSETFLSEVNGCQGLQTYLCGDSRLGCVAYKDMKTNTSFLDFSANGYKAKVNLALDYKNWFLSSEAMIANSCSNSSTVYRDSYGLIGMGIRGDASSNSKTETFSIAVLNGTKAKLIFGMDKSLAVEKQPLVTLTANEDWHLTGVSTLVVGTFSYALDDYNLIFDLNTQTISLPEPMYNAIIEKLKSSGVTSCSYGYQPTCDYYGDFKSLPNIIFEYNYQKITIPPELYVVNGKMVSGQRRIQLQFATTSPNPSNAYVVTADFYNYIVLGQPFLSYYYTVFDKASKSISLYTKAVPEDPKPNPNPNPNPNPSTEPKTDSKTNPSYPTNPSTSSGSSSGIWVVPFMIIFGVFLTCCKYFGKSCLKGLARDADQGAFTATVPSPQTILIQETIHVVQPAQQARPQYSDYDRPENYYYSPRDVPVFTNANAQDNSYFAPTYEAPQEPQQQGGFQQGAYNGNRYL